jgi:hypothetical protein
MRSYPILELVSGRQFRKYWENVLGICMDPGNYWDILPADARTEKNTSVAFCLSAKSVAGVHFTAWWRYDCYPWRLWLLVDPVIELEVAIEALSADCPKTWCTFTVKFFVRFPTKAALRSPECRAILLCVAVMLRGHMGRIDNRHAILRRLLGCRGSTWLCDLLSTCGDWIMLLVRGFQKDGWAAELRRKREAATPNTGTISRGSTNNHQATAKAKERTCHGGQQRAFNSEWLRRNKRCEGETKSAYFTRLSAAAQARSVDEVRRYVEIGRLATLSSQVGGRAFGARRRRTNRQSTENQSATQAYASSEPGAIVPFSAQILAVASGLTDVLAKLKNLQAESSLRTQQEAESSREECSALVQWSQSGRYSLAPNAGLLYANSLPNISQNVFPEPIACPGVDIQVSRWIPPNVELAGMVA